MPSDRARAALIDIRDNIDLAVRFVAGTTRTGFGDDKLVYYAVIRCLEIISARTSPRTPPPFAVAGPGWHSAVVLRAIFKKTNGDDARQPEAACCS